MDTKNPRWRTFIQREARAAQSPTFGVWQRAYKDLVLFYKCFRYSDPTFSECLQPVWLPYGDSEWSKLTIHFQRLPRTLPEIQHHPQARDPSLSVEEWPLQKCHWEINLKRLLEKSTEEETSMEDILLNICDTPLDANTPSPYELMFHRKVKSDLPSVPLSLFDSTNAGHRSVKHAERMNESENRGQQLRLEQHQTVMFMKKPQKKKAWWSSGMVVSVDGQQSYTVEDNPTGTQYSRDLVHIKPIVRNAPTPPTEKASSKRRKEGASVPVEMPSTKAMASPPKLKPESPMKQKADNPTDSVKTSRPRHIMKAPAKYGYEQNLGSDIYTKVKKKKKIGKDNVFLRTFLVQNNAWSQPLVITN